MGIRAAWEIEVAEDIYWQQVGLGGTRVKYVASVILGPVIYYFRLVLPFPA